MGGRGDDPLAWGRVAEEVRDEGRGRVDKGKLNVHVPRVCHVHSGFFPRHLNSRLSPLSLPISLPSLRTSHDIHTTSTTQYPRHRPDTPTCRHADTTHDTSFFLPCASQGAQRTAPLHLLWGCHQQGRVRGTRQRATLAAGGVSGARLGGDGCGDGLRPEEWCLIRQGMRAQHGTRRGVWGSSVGPVRG